VLVEANSADLGDLLAAVDAARNVPGVVAVSMSWGAGAAGIDPAAQAAIDQSVFTTPANHTGITFVAAAGDDGGLGGSLWPAASPNVLSVGGTTLTAAGETAWAGSGAGPVDVAYNADPATGFAVYSSVDDGGQSGWFQVGGTSAGAPQWSALIAIADQGRQLAGAGTPDNWSLDGASQTLPLLFGLAADPAAYARDFNDITAGANAQGAAGPGYDPVTGLGSPSAGHLVLDLVAGGTPTTVAAADVAIAVKATPVAATTPATRTVEAVVPVVSVTASATGIALVPAWPQPVPAPVSGVGLLLPAPRQEVSASAGGGYLEEAVAEPATQPLDTVMVTHAVVRRVTPVPIQQPPGASEVPVGAWRQACDECFTNPQGLAGVEDEGDGLPPASGEDAGGAALKSVAGLAALGLILAEGWVVPAEDEPRRRLRR
jgi:hypothetical protein